MTSNVLLVIFDFVVSIPHSPLLNSANSLQIYNLQAVLSRLHCFEVWKLEGNPRVFRGCVVIQNYFQYLVFRFGQQCCLYSLFFSIVLCVIQPLLWLLACKTRFMDFAGFSEPLFELKTNTLRSIIDHRSSIKYSSRSHFTLRYQHLLQYSVQYPLLSATIRTPYSHK